LDLLLNLRPDNNYCEKCNTFSDYFGFCIDHYNQDEIDKYTNEYIDEIITNKTKSTYFFEYYKDYYNIIKKSIYELKKVCKFYFSKVYTYHNFSIQQNYKYINNNFINNDKFNIDYESINTIFDDNMCYDIIINFNKKTDCEINFIILMVFLLKKYTYDIKIYKNLLKNNYNNIYYKHVFIGNNNILYNKICNSNLINNIEFMETEKSVRINNQILRFDIYIILYLFNVNNDYKWHHYEVVIETDEKHHFNINTNQNDLLKDEYCIKNGISMIHIDIDNGKITNYYSEIVEGFENKVKEEREKKEKLESIIKESKEAMNSVMKEVREEQ
jgi:hypothetical protein